MPSLGELDQVPPHGVLSMRTHDDEAFIKQRRAECDTIIIIIMIVSVLLCSLKMALGRKFGRTKTSIVVERLRA